MPALAHLDAVVAQQALVVGRALDAVTGEPVRTPPSATLRHDEPEGRPVGLAARWAPGRHVVFAGRPDALRQPGAGETLRLRLDVAAEGYAPVSDTFELSVADLDPGPHPRRIDGRDVEVLAVDAPLHSVVLLMAPLPVALAGRVVGAEDGAPVDDALVETLGAGAVSTRSGPDGFFQIDALPVRAEVEVRVTAAGFAAATHALPVDYGRPVARLDVRLPPS